MMPQDQQTTSLIVVPATGDRSPLAAIADVLADEHARFDPLGPLTHVALRDPYLREQLETLHAQWEVRPPAAGGLLARIRTRLAWWLLGPEVQQINASHASLVRVIDSLVVQLDQERAARRRIEEYLATNRDQS